MKKRNKTNTTAWQATIPGNKANPNKTRRKHPADSYQLDISEGGRA